MFAGFSRIADSPRATFVVLTIASLLAYANIWHNEFVFDDLVLITRDTFLTSWQYVSTLFITHVGDGFSGGYFHSPFYRPLQMLLYLIVYQLAGPTASAFHALNLVLHITNACLLYMLGLRLGFSKKACLGAALLWSLHPVHTEAITYMSGTADPLCALFLLSGVLILAGGFNRKHILAACACQVLALVSKETAVAFPLLAMGVLYYQSEDRGQIKTYRPTWPFWAIAGAYLFIRAITSGNHGFLDAFADSDAGILNRLWIALATLPTYLRLILWPSGLHVEREFSTPPHALFPLVIGGATIVASSAIVVLRDESRTLRPLVWGILWAAAAHLPQTGILTPVNAPICEHWLYIPMMGLILGTAQSFALRLAEERQNTISVARTLVAVAAILLGTKTFLQNYVWRNSETLYQNVFDNGEKSDRAHTNLGEYYLSQDEFDKGIAQLKIVVTGRGPLSRWPELHFLLAAGYLGVNPDVGGLKDEIREIGRALPHSSHIPDAIHELEIALSFDPDMFWANEMLAQIYAYRGDEEKTREYLLRAEAGLKGKRAR